MAPCGTIAHSLGRAADTRLPRGRARLPLRRPTRGARLLHAVRAGEGHSRALGLASTGPPVSPAHSEGHPDAVWQDDVPTLQQSSR